MIPALLTVFACSGSGDIPRDLGTFSEVAELRRAWLAASPDHWRLIQILRRSTTYPDSTCPLETVNDLELSWDGDCTDSAGATWTGSATVREEERHQDFLGWGLTYQGVTWTLDGEMDWTWPDLTEPEEQIDIDLTVSWTDGTDSLTGRIDVSYLTANDGTGFDLLWTEGEVGWSDWGTAEVTTEVLRLGRSNSCNFPTSGELVLTAENTGSVPFDDDHCLEACPTGHIDGDPVGDLCLDGGLPQLLMPGYAEDTGTAPL